MLKAINDFYKIQVKDLYPQEFWGNDKHPESTSVNKLLALYNKTENDDFTIKDMIDEMLSEFPLYASGFYADKTLPTVFWLSFAPLYNDSDFFKLDISECFAFFKQCMEEKGLKTYGYFELNGADGLVPLCYSMYPFIEENCYSLNCDDIEFAPKTLGEAVKTLGIALNLHNFCNCNYLPDVLKEISFISNNALVILRHIFTINPLFVESVTSIQQKKGENKNEQTA